MTDEPIVIEGTLSAGSGETGYVLLPCPFCGATPAFLDRGDEFEDRASYNALYFNGLISWLVDNDKLGRDEREVAARMLLENSSDSLK